MEDDKYILTVLRYIHQKPIKAGIERYLTKYPWSSYNEYLGKSGVCDTRFPLSLFADERTRAITLFQQFHNQENDDKCLDYEERVLIDDIEASTIIIKVAGVGHSKEVQKLKKEERDSVIKDLKDNGLSIRQIERITGVSFGVIRRI